MKLRNYSSMWLCILLLLSPLLSAAENKAVTTPVKEVFSKGPLLNEFGANAEVKQTYPINKDQKFKVVFDVSEMGDAKTINGHFNSLARFLNLHVRAGVDPENIQLAMVVHGSAGFALYNEEKYQQKYQQSNPNHALLKALMENNVKVILCGQSAAYNQIANEDVIDGVEVALSAMTAHALLQQQGYTLNPF